MKPTHNYTVGVKKEKVYIFLPFVYFSSYFYHCEVIFSYIKEGSGLKLIQLD